MRTFILIGLVISIIFGATNDSTIDSAVLKRIYMGNYSYNTCISSQPILTMRWASDLNRPVFKNRTGTLYKALMDASTTSNTPQYRVFFADGNGLASSSSALVYTNGNLHSDYFSGDSVVVTGKVKAATGIYSGTLDAPTLNTGHGDNELYQMNQNVTSTSNVTFNTTTAGIVKADLHVLADSIKIGAGKYITANASNSLIVKDGISAVDGNFSGTLAKTNIFKVDSVVKIGDSLNYPFYSDSPIWGISDLHIRGVNRFPKGRFTAIGNGNKSWLAFDRANGSFASPTGLLAGDHFASILGVGYPSGGATMVHGPELTMEVCENWSTTNTGCALHFKSIPKGLNYQVSSLYLNGYKSVFGSTDTSFAMVTIRDSVSKTNQLAIYGPATTAPINFGTFINEAYIYSNLYYLDGVWAQNNNALRSYGLQLGNNGFGIYRTNAGSTTRLASLLFDTVYNDATFGNGVNATNFRAYDSVKGSCGQFSHIIANGDGIRFNCKDEVPFIYKDSLHNNIIIGPKFNVGEPNTTGIVIDAFLDDTVMHVWSDTVNIKNIKINKTAFEYAEGSFTSYWYGYTTSPIDMWCGYVRNGKTVTVTTNSTVIGTSNSSELYFTGLPSSVRPSNDQYASVGTYYTNGSSGAYGTIVAKITTAGNVYLYLPSTYGGWSSSGSKGLLMATFTFSLY